MGLRVDEEEEREGLDYSEHGMHGYQIDVGITGGKHSVVEAPAASARVATELASSES
jgi:hypothetical protein